MGVFEYIVIVEPKDDAGNVIQDEVTVHTDRTTVIAANPIAVEKKVLMELNDPELNSDFVQVLVRPFEGMPEQRFR